MTTATPEPRPARRPARRWATASTTAALLAGSLVAGAPAASAAPGAPACPEATAAFETAVAGTGITPQALAQVELSAEAVAAAEARYAALVGGAGGPSLQELEQAAQQLALAQESGDPAAVAAAEARLAELDARLGTALEGVDPAAAQQAVAESTVVLDGLLAQLGIDQATAAQLAGLLEQAALACGAAPAAPAPVAPAPAEAAPVAAPVEAAPVAAPVEAAPVGVNPGFDVQTGADARSSGTPLLLAGAGTVLLVGAATVLVRRRARF
ncbi:hypothetical protein AS188_16025 (plasmid) [Kocuria flava]|uniref:Gram-positive cocci surface proteins LPxTG domain-containing protein n=2 Tax=Kocuria flava TaxID=446860 RepID=A0A0U2XTF2_9MICC|nr:hypothetical protein [Kocuria flava]ALU41394.1 hypothetical protein AS188_16025 [Kocuria flava]